MTDQPTPLPSSGPTPSTAPATDAGPRECPTCGPLGTEPHPRLPGVIRCRNCKEHLAPAPYAGLRSLLEHVGIDLTGKTVRVEGPTTEEMHQAAAPDDDRPKRYRTVVYQAIERGDDPADAARVLADEETERVTRELREEVEIRGREIARLRAELDRQNRGWDELVRGAQQRHDDAVREARALRDRVKAITEATILWRDRTAGDVGLAVALGGILDADEPEPPATAAVARVRRFCEMTIRSSVRVQARQQAHDTLAVLDQQREATPAQQPGRRTTWTPGPVAVAQAAEWGSNQPAVAQQPAAAPRHTGGNAEDCPACEEDAAAGAPPYPFLCPGEKEAGQ